HDRGASRGWIFSRRSRRLTGGSGAGRSCGGARPLVHRAAATTARRGHRVLELRVDRTARQGFLFNREAAAPRWPGGVGDDASRDRALARDGGGATVRESPQEDAAGAERTPRP